LFEKEQVYVPGATGFSAPVYLRPKRIAGHGRYANRVPIQFFPRRLKEIIIHRLL
jgi:hypothetical protein